MFWEGDYGTAEAVPLRRTSLMAQQANSRFPKGMTERKAKALMTSIMGLR
jgi:hypothetical protein